MHKLFTKLFRTQTERDLKTLQTYVSANNSILVQFKNMDNDTLRSKTSAVRSHIQEHLQPLVDEQNALKKRAEEDTSTDIDQREQLYESVEKLKNLFNQRIE